MNSTFLGNMYCLKKAYLNSKIFQNHNPEIRNRNNFLDIICPKYWKHIIILKLQYTKISTKESVPKNVYYNYLEKAIFFDIFCVLYKFDDIIKYLFYIMS